MPTSHRHDSDHATGVVAGAVACQRPTATTPVAWSAVEPDTRPATPRRPRGSLWLTVGLALGVGLFYAGTEAFFFDGRLGFPLDDSWIHLAFARNLAAGEGLSINPGELVTGTTAPLWTGLLSILFVLPGSPVIWLKLLGIVLFALSVELVYRLCRELDLPVGLAHLAAALTALTEWLAWSALSGLEIPLFTALSLGGMLRHVRERRREGAPPISIALLAAACLARPEGLLLLALAFVDRLLVFDREPGGGLVLRSPPWRTLVPGLALGALLVLPMVAFNVAVGGSPLPTTFGAKVPPGMEGGATDVVPSLRYLLRAPIDVLFRAQPYMVLLAGAGLLALAGRLGTDRDRGLLPAAWLVGLPLAYGALSAASGETVAGNFGRYYFPLFPIVIVVGVVGLERLAELLAGGVRLGRLRLPVRAALLAVVLLPTLLGLVRGSQRFVQSVANVYDGNVQAARWLRERIPPEAVVAVSDIGVFGFVLPNRIIDLAGIAHPEARQARYDAAAAGRLADEGTLQYLSEQRPDFLAIFPAWFPALVAEGSPFTPVARFEVPNNITLFGDEIVVYSTPWAGRPPGVVEE